MSYLGAPPARAPLSSAQIEDGTIATIDLAAGAVTTAKITDANVTAAKVSSDVSQLGKNLIINGAMTVAQRGTQTGVGASGGYHNDQFRYTATGTPTARFTTSKGTGITGAPGSQRIIVTTADSALAAGVYYSMTTNIEGQNLQHLGYGTASAKAMTYQAVFKTDWAGTMTLVFSQPDGSRYYATPVALEGDESQEVFTFTLSGDASGQIDNNTGNGFVVSLMLAAGSNFQGGTTGAWAASNNNILGAHNTGNFTDTIGNYIEFSLVQLEVGSVATDFEHEPFSVTLAKCQRYLYVPGAGAASANEIVGQGIASSTTVALVKAYPPVEMRAAIAVTATAGDWKLNDGTASFDVTALAASVAGRRSIRLTVTVASGLTQYRDCELIADGTANRILAFTAEL